LPRKGKIPRTDEDYNMKPEEGKKITITADMNELTNTELILLIKRTRSRYLHY
jgi:hypothetical protein